MALHTEKVNRSRRQHLGTIGALEAAGIRGLPGDRPLRLKVVGDFPTEHYARKIVGACEDYRYRSGRPVWGYTHNWKRLRRGVFGRVSMLASCETVGQARAAMRKGYAAALVVKEHLSGRHYLKDGLRVIPCPYETRGVKCSDCKLCFDDRRLRAGGLVIGFAAHGSGRGKVLEVLDGRTGS
jgi:hypothetical protein